MPARVVGTVALLLLGACGQKGALYLPGGDVAAARASLPQALNPMPDASAPAGTGTANPVPRP